MMSLLDDKTLGIIFSNIEDVSVIDWHSSQVLTQLFYADHDLQHSEFIAYATDSTHAELPPPIDPLQSAGRAPKSQPAVYQQDRRYPSRAVARSVCVQGDLTGVTITLANTC